MRDIKELKSKIAEQAFRLQGAKANGFMINQETERMKNILMNNLDDIVEALKFADEAQDKIDILTADLNDADQELEEKDDEIAALKAAAAPKPKGKAKKTDVESPF